MLIKIQETMKADGILGNLSLQPGAATKGLLSSVTGAPGTDVTML